MTAAKIVAGVVIGFCASTVVSSQSIPCETKDCGANLAVAQRATKESLEVFEINDTASVSTRSGHAEELALNVSVKPTPPVRAPLASMTLSYDVSAGMSQQSKEPFEVAVLSDSVAAADSHGTSTADFNVIIMGEALPRPKGLMALYQVYLGLSAVDGTLTWFGVRRGAAERNPILAYHAGNAFTLLAVKAGTSASTIYFAERLRRNHPRQAVVMMAAISGALSWVVCHDAEVVRTLRSCSLAAVRGRLSRAGKACL